MKIICSGSDLNDAVSKVFKAVSARTTNPILEGIKLCAEGGSLTLTATDEELTIQRSIVASVNIDGETVVPGKFFADYLKRLTKEQIELSLDENNALTLRYGESDGTLMCMNAADFPKARETGDGQSFTISKKDFKNMVNKTAFSVCIDDSRPVLKGVYLEIDHNTVTAVALDGYRLARCVKSAIKTTALMSAIVPARCIVEIARQMDDSDDPVEVVIQKNLLSVNLEHTKITTRLIEGEFLNYKQIIPSDFKTVATIPCEQFESSVERAILLTRVDKNFMVRFDILGDTVILSSNSELGSVKEKIPAKVNGNDLAIAFNAKYFMELSKYFDSDNMVIKFTNSVSPCLVEPSGGDTDYMYLILPVRMM